MDFATAVENSKSGRRYLKKYNDLQLMPNNLPTANDLDKAESDEQKAYKRLASAVLRLADAKWWASAPKTDQADRVLCELTVMVNEGYRIDILSSPFEEESIKGKLEWCNNTLPNWLFTKFHIRSDKETFANSKSILIDDREKVCKKFSEAGGCAVLFDEEWLLSLKEVLKNNPITTIYCDLDGVLVDTQSHIAETLKSL